jgi:RelA/SpoT family (p)ppGpp synthetase
MADAAHAGQLRKSGEPYIEHPLEVARILAAMHMDGETLAAALLHDTIEDTPADKPAIALAFGSGVAHIVDGVSKLAQFQYTSRVDAQSRNLQKMIMAMSNDIRVILVKLADRLHNMRTLRHLPPAKRALIARETLEIYAPIAQRFGINTIRLELEELGFQYLYPMRYRVLVNEVQRLTGRRKEMVTQIESAIKRRLEQEQLPGEVFGREKHLYSIYRKMREKTFSFSEVFDVYGFRVIVDTVDSCYRVLGAVHNLYKPVPGKFKDYIAIPKANGYQSLHTVLFGPYGVPIEVQIRTQEMDQVAEAGIAAHWLYKVGDRVAKTAHKRAHEWLKGILEMQRQAGDPEEFLEHVKVDLFPDEVYVFTPKGDIIELPRGATAVDLAYAIHTDVGHACVGARVDRRLVPLRTPLVTGQTVEILTAPGARPDPSWLNFVISGKARANIRHFLKNLRHDEARRFGDRLLSRELSSLGLDLQAFPAGRLPEVLEALKVETLDQLLEEIGLGNRMAPLVARAFQETTGGPPGSAEARGPARPLGREGATAPLLIEGTEGMVVSFPKCCYPIPGDPIMGYVSAGRGIVVHQQSCTSVAEYRSQPDKWVDIRWAAHPDRDFATEIRADVVNRRGMLATIAAAIADENINIEEVEMSDRDDRCVNIRFVISVRDRRQLASLLRHVRRIPGVLRMQRKKA